MCGFFADHRRVRIKKIRGMVSAGYIFGIGELIAWKPKLKKKLESINLEELVDTFFDQVDGDEFCHVYIPKRTGKKMKISQKSNENYSQKKLKKFDCIIPEEFKFHYDTSKLGDRIWLIKPDDTVSITVKVHGTSFIISNVKTRKPLKISWISRMYNRLLDSIPGMEPFRVKDCYVEYDVIYSSRHVIKNQYINENATSGGFYSTDIYGEYYKLLKDYIPQGMSIYGEIFGYETADKYIQHKYDYGCEPGKNKLMIYRITSEIENGKYEWNISEIVEWTNHFLHEHPELKEYIYPLQVLYHGTLSKLYPDIPVDENWHENVLLAMKNDKEHFCMEMNEPLCNNKVPREGIVVRIDYDPICEAFKLKTDAYALREVKDMESGVVDMEI